MIDTNSHETPPKKKIKTKTINKQKPKNHQ